MAFVQPTAETVAIKYAFAGSLRRANLTVPLTVASLQQRVDDSFGALVGATRTLSYTDDEGDNMTVATDEELAAASACAKAQGRVLLLRVDRQPEAESEAVELPTAAAEQSEPKGMPPPVPLPTPTDVAADRKARHQKIQQKRAAGRREPNAAKSFARFLRLKRVSAKQAAAKAAAAAPSATACTAAAAAAAANAAAVPPFSTGHGATPLAFEPYAAVAIGNGATRRYGRVVHYNAQAGKYLVTLVGDASSMCVANHYWPYQLMRVASIPATANTAPVHDMSGRARGRAGRHVAFNTPRRAMAPTMNRGVPHRAKKKKKKKNAAECSAVSWSLRS